MTPEQIEICLSFGHVTALPGSWDKRMMNNLNALASHNPEKELSEKQNEWMYRLLYKYRKQIPETFRKYNNHPFCSHLKPKK